MSDEVVSVQDINTSDRIRSEMGDIDGLANSIKEDGLINPILLDLDGGKPRLIAGERRLRALTRLGYKELRHYNPVTRQGEFILVDEARRDPLRLAAIELEENVKRKELTWQEQVLGKQRLLEIMQQIHGKVAMGPPSKAQQAGLASPGFGVNKLAAMLGESPGSTSRDLSIAKALQFMPVLVQSPTKEAAFKRVKVIGIIAAMQAAQPKVKQEHLWTLHEGDFRDNASKIPDSSVDLVYVDLPYGVDLQQMVHHATGNVDYADERQRIVEALSGVAEQSFRVLRSERFGVFFFGFNYYNEIVRAMELAGFDVNPVPVVWLKHTASTENPYTRYANGYEQALIVMKGKPSFIRQGRVNVKDYPAIAPSERVQIAQQPVSLVKDFILDMTAEGATVVDWMCGSGTTGVAACELKRQAILFEKEPMAILLTKGRLAKL